MTDENTRRFPWWIKLPIGIGVIVLVVAGVIHFLGLSATARWERYAAKLREDGTPLDYMEIERARAAVPDEENSASLVASLVPLIPEITMWDVDPGVFVFGEMEDGDDFFTGIARSRIEPSRAFLEQHEKLIEAILPLSDMPNGRYGLVFGGPMDWGTPDLTEYRTLAKLLYLLSYVELIDGELEEAPDTAVLVMRLAAALDDQPSTIGHLVRLASDHLALRILMNALRVGELPPEDIEHVEYELSERHATLTMRWALLSERAIFAAVCESLAARQVGLTEILQGKAANAIGVSVQQELPVWQVRRNQMFAVELLTRLLDRSDQTRELYDTARAIDRERASAPETYLLAKILLPSLARVCFLHCRLRAELRCAITALAAERFRMDSGRFPTSLDDLVPDFIDEIPLDPFGTGPVRLAETDEGVVVYSIGTDPEDENGLDARLDDPGNDAEIGFWLVNIERRGIVLIDLPPPDKED